MGCVVPQTDLADYIQALFTLMLVTVGGIVQADNHR